MTRSALSRRGAAVRAASAPVAVGEKEMTTDGGRGVPGLAAGDYMLEVEARLTTVRSTAAWSSSLIR
jgi:hypothetical protein